MSEIAAELRRDSRRAPAARLAALVSLDLDFSSW